MVNMKEMIDAPIAQLVLDLEERGLLDRTLDRARERVQPRHDDRRQARARRCATQARVPERIEELKYYGMHRHFTEAGCVLLFGGGMKRGYVHGATADERPCKAVRDPVTITDLHATIYRAMGISPKLSYVVEERPFYVTKDGLGKPVTACSRAGDRQNNGHLKTADHRQHLAQAPACGRRR